MRIALHSTIRPGAVGEYRQHHARIPDELRDVFERVGIHDWVIWRSGDRLFHVVDVDDFDAAFAALGDDPANARWQADIGRFVDRFFGAEGSPGLEPLEAVWSLRRQQQDEASP
ncbi:MULTISPECIES: L-rhamnose mutarotase [unclassified Isoptericola]|uniref:L-rhamnose mutarotase n=1 Tax=unclassified Isoptericola TaxID=2623355 RepID=UPI0036603A30